MGATVGAAASSSPGGTPSQMLAPSIEGFDTLINEQVSKYVNLSEELGGVVAEQVRFSFATSYSLNPIRVTDEICPQASAVLRAFGAERKILIVATKAKKPDVSSPIYMEILTDLQRQISIVCDIREANRASPFFNHLSAVSDGINALGWITDSKPADQIADALGSAQFFGNRVLREYKDKEPLHVEWIQSFYALFKGLTFYVKQHHATGLSWNSKSGVDAKEALSQVQSSSTTPVRRSTAFGGAPPPPPPPLPRFDNDGPPAPPKSTAQKSSGDMNAVFSQLNQGSAVTSSLRKVDRSEMTHKNPSLRTSAVVPQRSSSSSSGGAPSKRPKPEGMRAKKPPRQELDGNKWLIVSLPSGIASHIRKKPSI